MIDYAASNREWNDAWAEFWSSHGEARKRAGRHCVKLAGKYKAERAIAWAKIRKLARENERKAA